jgi:hypothetical protein
MKKTILTLATLAIMGSSFQSNAAVGISTGGLGGGLLVVLGGLTLLNEAASPLVSSRNISVFGILAGLILLDGENGQEIQFKKLPVEELKKMNLTAEEAAAYNDNTAELTEAFKMVSSEVTTKTTMEESRKLWADQAEIIGENAINGARKVLSFNLSKAK